MSLEIWICSQNLLKKDTGSTDFRIFKVIDWKTSGLF